MLVLLLAAAGCAPAPGRPGADQASVDGDQTRNDLNRMISEYGDDDGRLTKLRDSLPSPSSTKTRQRRDVLVLSHGQGPAPLSPKTVIDRKKSF